MITMNLKDAFQSSRSMPITRNIYFFEWKSELWEFSCLLFELSLAPRVFTKVMKLVIGKIRSQGIRSVIDLDDMAVLKPCQRIQFLGFTIDSSSMMVSLPQEKLNKLVERASATLLLSKRSIREVAEVIRLIASSFQVIKLARLHYWNFLKSIHKKKKLNDFDAACSLSQETK